MADGAGRDGNADQCTDLAELRAAGEEHPLGFDPAPVGEDGAYPLARVAGRGFECGEATALAEVDARRLHRQRVGAQVSHGIDATIGRRIAGATNARCSQRRVESHRLARIDPADVEAGLPLHRDALATGALFIIGGGENQVPELAKARVGAEEIGLAPVEVDAPLAESDRRRGPALRADHAGRPAAGPIAGPSPFEDHDPLRSRGPGKIRGPSTDGAGAHDDDVRALLFCDPSPPRLLSAPTMPSPASGGGNVRARREE